MPIDWVTDTYIAFTLFFHGNNFKSSIFYLTVDIHLAMGIYVKQSTTIAKYISKSKGRMHCKIQVIQTNMHVISNQVVVVMYSSKQTMHY